MAISKKFLNKAKKRLEKLKSEKKEGELSKEEIKKAYDELDEYVSELEEKEEKEEKFREGSLSKPLTGSLEETKQEKKKGIEISEASEEAIKNLPLEMQKIPDEYTGKISSKWKPPSLHETDKTYPLIEPFAYANLKWEEENERLFYSLMEPEMTESQEEKLQSIKDVVINMMQTKAGEISEEETERMLKEKMNKAIKEYGIQTTENERKKIFYYLKRDFLGLGKIEPLMHDPSIEDLSCDGIGIPLYIYHRKYASVPTNIVFEDGEKLDSFITKLAQKCGRHISVADPLLDGALPDGSRVQATYSAQKDIAMQGSTFTIRKFSEDPFTVTDMVNFGTIPALIAAYLWLTIEYNKTLLVSGGTASGKTSMLNSLSMFIPQDQKIVSIEDTPEIRLPHEHWTQKVVRTGFGRRSEGGVSMQDLLKSALRERPDELIVGEVRGEEAYVLFQGMASVRGDEEVTVVTPEGKTEKIEIKKLMEKDDLEDYKTVSIDPETRETKLLPVKACVEHAPRKKLYKLKTRTGKEVTVTGDHSVFVSEDGRIKEKEVKEIEEGEKLVTPAKMPCGYADKKYLNLAEELEDIRVKAPKYVKKASEKLGWKKAGEIAGVETISDYYGKEKSALKADQYFGLLEKAEVTNSPDDIEVKFERRSETHPAKLEITPELLRLIGYYISEGSLNTAKKNNTIQLYNSDEDVLEDMRHCIQELAGKEPRERKVGGWGESTELTFSHKVIYEFLKQKCGHGSRNKKVPSFIYGLSKEKIGEFLSALWTGDGSCRKKDFQYSTHSKELANGLTHLLLCFGIVPHQYQRKGGYYIDFYRRKEQENFQEYIKPINKQVELERNTQENKRRINETYEDPVKEIQEIELDEPEHVYDLNVPGTQNFIGGFGGIMLHNTGHPGLSTIHADSVDAVLHRLMTPPIELSTGLLQHLDMVMILTKARVGGIEVRRMKELVEIVGMRKGEPITNKLIEWRPSNDSFQFASDKSYMLQSITKAKGVSEESIWKEVKRREKIIKWMQEENIRNYEEVGRIVTNYYSNPEKVLEKIEKPEVEER